MTRETLKKISFELLIPIGLLVFFAVATTTAVIMERTGNIGLAAANIILWTAVAFIWRKDLARYFTRKERP
jgi:ABC-type uncharacterized transport system permease subunit